MRAIVIGLKKDQDLAAIIANLKRLARDGSLFEPGLMLPAPHSLYGTPR
jgi:hypothetical protein